MAPVPIAQFEFELRPVKRALAGFDPTREPRAPSGVFQSALSAIPDRVRARALCGSSGKVDGNLREAQRAIEVVQRGTEARYLVLHVGFSQKYVAIVLGELPQAQ